MRNFFLQFLAIFLLSSSLYAKQVQQYPNVNGSVLFQVAGDRVLSSQKTGVPANNAFVYVETNMGINFNRNWSVRTDWRLQPNKTLTTRDPVYPERYRTFFSSNRGYNTSDMGLIVEELKLQFENDDMKFVAGKFDPTFGTAHNKSKRIGVFTSQFTEDYNLREKLGAGVTALLEDSKLSFNTFFNDTTGLSQSAINNRGRADRSNGLAGNTGTLSSYSIAMDGGNLFGYENWFYNVGYRSLGVDKMDNRAREKGYVLGSEYLYKIGSQSSLIPFIELVKINNFTGAKDRNATYTTIALIGKYSNWTGSISRLSRSIKASQSIPSVSDHQLQMTAGYKFTDNFTVDVSRATIKEGGNKGSLFGVTMSYLYKF